MSGSRAWFLIHSLATFHIDYTCRYCVCCFANNFLGTYLNCSDIFICCGLILFCVLPFSCIMERFNVAWEYVRRDELLHELRARGAESTDDQDAHSLLTRLREHGDRPVQLVLTKINLPGEIQNFSTILSEFRDIISEAEIEGEISRS